MLLNSYRDFFLSKSKISSEALLQETYVPIEQTQFTDLNIQSMAFLIKLFERKHKLIQCLWEINTSAENLQNFSEEKQRQIV